MIQPSQQHVALCVKGVERILGARGLIMTAAFWAGTLVEVTQKTSVVSRCKRAAIGTPSYSPHTTQRRIVGVLYPPPTGGSHRVVNICDDKNLPTAGW